MNKLEDNEMLYRRVVFDALCFQETEEGLKVTPQAFRDRVHQPSVDRAKLCNHNPKYTQGDDSRNGVVSLVTGEVRAIANVVKGKPPIQYDVDVVYAPLPDNQAHAEIRTHPKIRSKKVFKRLRVSLAILANRRGWLIPPGTSNQT